MNVIIRGIARKGGPRVGIKGGGNITRAQGDAVIVNLFICKRRCAKAYQPTPSLTSTYWQRAGNDHANSLWVTWRQHVDSPMHCLVSGLDYRYKLVLPKLYTSLGWDRSYALTLNSSPIGDSTSTLSHSTSWRQVLNHVTGIDINMLIFKLGRLRWGGHVARMKKR